MVAAHIHLLLDANKSAGELMAECPSCGVITLETLQRAWAKRFIACECGISMEIVPEQLRQLKALAAGFEQQIDELIGRN